MFKSVTSNFKCRQVDKYDGQSIFAAGKVVYELGNYLGGGASGSVYQAFDPAWAGTERGVAVKILNPLGYKNTVFGQINQCTVLSKGQPLSAEQIYGKAPMTADNVWWLLHPSTKTVFAAFEDPHRLQLRELPLTRCVEIWGMNPLNMESLTDPEVDKINQSSISVPALGKSMRLPLVSPKYLRFLRSRQLVCREMSNMAQVGDHPNIVSLLEVLELVQDSKTTLFLVLDLINGGELFDRLKAGIAGNVEEFARRYFTQLISGLEYCHKKGVVHRDLKPENLLLSDPSDSAILKIADFGLSAVIMSADLGAAAGCNPSLKDSSKESKEMAPLLVRTGSNNGGASIQGKRDAFSTPAKLEGLSSVRRLRSVVGSPHYIAPEIGLDDPAGYDGRKVDMWSAGIILYSLFTGALPFGSDLSCCPRYKRYKTWICTEYAQALKAGQEIQVPSWFWPPHISPLVGSLLVGLLHFDPALRLTAAEVMRHPWYLNQSSSTSQMALSISRQPSPELMAMRSMSSQTLSSPPSFPRAGEMGDLTTATMSMMVTRNAGGQETSTITRLLQHTHLDPPSPVKPAVNMHVLREQQRQKEAAAMMGDAYLQPSPHPPGHTHPLPAAPPPFPPPHPPQSRDGGHNGNQDSEALS